jgi:prepilin-type N-terminal cleavage/methylation domain-containing protein
MQLNRQGFTLLELLVVIAIMVILMTIAVANYGGIRRGAELRGAVMSVRTTLMLARQEAVTKRRNITVEFKRGATLTDPDIIKVLFNSMGKVITNSVVTLPIGVQYDDSPAVPASITFKPSGGALGAGSQDIKLIEKQGATTGIKGTRSLKVWFLTGITKEN